MLLLILQLLPVEVDERELFFLLLARSADALSCQRCLLLVVKVLLFLLENFLSALPDVLVCHADAVITGVSVQLFFHHAVVVALHLLLLQVLCVHLSQLDGEVSLASLLSLDVVVVVLQRRFEQLFPFHLLNAALLLLPVLLVGKIVDSLSFLLHALEQLLVLHVCLVTTGLGNKVLHLLVLVSFLALLDEDIVLLDFNLLVQIGLLNVGFAFLLRRLVQLDLDVQ